MHYGMIKGLSINICICDLSPLKGKTIIHFLITRSCAFVGNLVWTLFESAGIARGVCVCYTNIYNSKPGEESRAGEQCSDLVLKASLSLSPFQFVKHTRSLLLSPPIFPLVIKLLCGYTQMLTSSTSVLLLSVYVRVSMCALWS